MPRPVDHARRSALLDAAVDYAIDYGFADLSWRPVATALGVSTTTLMYHFGTKERMLEAILGRVRDRIFVATTDQAEPQTDLAAAARAIWSWSADPQRRAMFRLFFAVYGRALQQPAQFDSFLSRVVTDWMQALDPPGPPVPDGAERDIQKTLVIATIRGLLLDLLTTGDEPRVHRAFDSFARDLDRPGRPGADETRQ